MQGKQLAVVMSSADEGKFIDWLRGTATMLAFAMLRLHP